MGHHFFKFLLLFPVTTLRKVTKRPGKQKDKTPNSFKSVNKNESGNTQPNKQNTSQNVHQSLHFDTLLFYGFGCPIVLFFWSKPKENCRCLPGVLPTCQKQSLGSFGGCMFKRKTFVPHPSTMSVISESMAVLK